jgi:uncharacterized membrane protein YqjE
MASESERSVSAVLQNIVRNIEHIIRAEIRLATAEVREEVGKAGRASKLLALGTVLALGAFGSLLLSCIYLLATLVALWLAALIVALGVGVVAAALIATGLKHLQQVNTTTRKTLASTKTVASIKENVA